MANTDLDDRMTAVENDVAALKSANPSTPAGTDQSLTDRVGALEVQAQQFASEDSALMVRVSKIEVEVFPPVDPATPTA